MDSQPSLRAYRARSTLNENRETSRHELQMHESDARAKCTSQMRAQVTRTQNPIARITPNGHNNSNAMHLLTGSRKIASSLVNGGSQARLTEEGRMGIVTQNGEMPGSVEERLGVAMSTTEGAGFDCVDALSLSGSFAYSTSAVEV